MQAIDAKLHQITGEIVEVHAKSGATWARFRVRRGTKSDWVTCKYAVTVGQIVDVLCAFNDKFRSYDVVRAAGENGEVSNSVVCAYIQKNLPGVGAIKTSYLEKSVGPGKLYASIVDNPQWVVQSVGAKIEDVNALVDVLKSHKAEFSDISSLTNYGYTPAIAKSITVLGLVSAALQSPYGIISKVPGLGWKLADEVGRSRGIPLDAPERLTEGIFHYYEECVRGDGHTAVSQVELCSPGGAGKFLGVNAELIRQYAEKALIPLGDVYFNSARDRENEDTISDFFNI